MRTGKVALALAAAATIVLPGTATAAPAACGTDPAQWVGVYEGTSHVEYENYPSNDIPLDVTITDSTAGLQVTTVLHNGEQTLRQYGDTVLENGRFHWATLQLAGWHYALHDHYDTTITTCGAAGVTRFGGTLEGWVNDEHVADGTFTLTRAT